MASEVKDESNSAASDVENVTADEEMKDASSKMKDGDKVKNESKEGSDKEGSDDDNEDDEDEEVALLDRPVMMTGCRARKKVERLEMSFSTPKEKQEFPEGKGKKLGECPRIEAQIQKMKVVDLKPLHKILFNRIGSANEIKKNIKKFCGFPFDKDSVEYTRKKASAEKMTAPVLKQCCLILDIERSGSKEEIVNRILTFLLNPEDSGKKVPSAKKRASKDKKKSASKKAKTEKKGKTEKNDKSDKSEEEPDKSEEDEEEEEEDDEDDSGGESSMGGTDEEAEHELVGDDSKKKPKEKTSKAKSKADKGKKEEKKPKGTKRKQEEDNDSSASSSDEQPPAKKSKMPSNEEITKLIKQILESADLQEITMKKVIKQVSDAYPDHDLTNKKAFIKSTIKSVIS